MKYKIKGLADDHPVQKDFNEYVHNMQKLTSKPTLTEWLEKEIAEDVEERWIFMLIKNKIKSGEFRGL